MTEPSENAFPEMIKDPWGRYLSRPGATKRDWFAAYSPIGFDDVVQALRKAPDLHVPAEREVFFARWAQLNFEYADAMMAEGQKTGGQNG